MQSFCLCPVQLSKMIIQNYSKVAAGQKQDLSREILSKCSFTSTACRRISLILAIMACGTVMFVSWSEINLLLCHQQVKAFTKVSEKINRWIGSKHYMHGPQWMKPTKFSDLVAPPLSWHGLKWNIFTTIGWIALKCGVDIHVPLRMKYNNFC